MRPNKGVIKTLNALCGRTEALQNLLMRKKRKTDDNRRLYEALSDAKGSLLEALNIAEGVS